MIISSRAADPVRDAERQLRRLHGEVHGVKQAVDWARHVLHDAELDPARRPLRSLRALRKADRRLSLVAARYLVTTVATGEPPRRSPRAGNPILH